MRYGILTVIFSLFFFLPAVSQKDLLDQLLNTSQAYIDFLSQPAKDAAEFQHQDTSEVDKINQAFGQYALSMTGQTDEKNGYRSLPKNKTHKLFKASKYLELNAWQFDLYGEQISIMSYNISQGIVELKNHVIINERKGMIVYTGNNNTCYIDWLYALDQDHLIYCMHHGELGMSRKVMVLNISAKEWKPTKAFKGSIPKEETRISFNLNTTFEQMLELPSAANQVFFAPASKELYHFRFIENVKTKVSAVWTNKLFKLDDYELLTETIGGAPPTVR